MQAENPQPLPDLTVFDVMAARVRAGEPIHTSCLAPEALGKAMLGTIERLKSETGKPVHIIFS